MSNPAVENAAPADDDDNDKGKYHLCYFNNFNWDKYYEYFSKNR